MGLPLGYPVHLDMTGAPTLAERLQQVTEVLAATTTQAAVFEIILSPAMEALGAIAGTVLLTQGDQLVVAASQGQPAPETSIWQDGPLGAETPATDAVRRQEPLYFEAAGDLVARYPALEARTGGRASVASAVLPMILNGQSVGVLVLDFREPHDFTPGERRFLLALASQCAVALGRARTARDLERQVQERTAALDAFVDFTESIDGETDVLALARQATEVLRANLGRLSVAYYEREGDCWVARVWSDDIPPDLMAQIQAGVPLDTPSYARVVRGAAPLFLSDWDATQEGLSAAHAYGAVSLYPYFVEGQPHSLLTTGTQDARVWSDRDQAIVRAVGRSLGLALERAEQARVIDEERAALAAFTAYTEAVGTQIDLLALVRQVAELMRGARAVDVTYFEREGDRFILRVWPDDLPLDWLARSQAGHALDEPGFAQAARARDTIFVDGGDALWRAQPESARYGAVALQPFFQGETMTSLLIMASRSAAHWTERDQGIIRAVGRSFALALERAEQARQLGAQRDLLDARTQALEVANEELEAFAYSVSHDLRTPVRHIAGYTDLLRKRLDDRLDAEAARYLAVVDQAAARMNTLLDAVLDLSRTSRAPLRVRPVDLNALVALVRQELTPDAAGRQVEWTVGPLPQVTADRDILHQVLVNLFSNALKYTRTREVARIEVWAEERLEGWAILVCDNGAGFDPTYQDKLFGVFQRLHRAEDFEGIGVGLANVRRGVTRHGGRVWAEGQPDAGATFGFSLPK